jgi:3-methyl-2-oxobutanoate hydroxymethyltransferase
MKKITADIIMDMKKQSDPITLLTAYSFPLAEIVDNMGVDVILVGDSVANVELGLESTKSVSMDDMIHHAKAAGRAVKRSMLIGDMPYEAYQINQDKALPNARRFIREAGCDGVKIEWFKDCINVIKDIINEGIPVMGHIGLTPQTAEELGGFKVQGRDSGHANALIKQAVALQQIGVFSTIIECVPDMLAKFITEILDIPTIGIGAGPYCDGQALVSHDLLGLTKGHKPKFVKQYTDLYSQIERAVTNYKDEVKKRIFPDTEHSYPMKAEEAAKLMKPDIESTTKGHT